MLQLKVNGEYIDLNSGTVISINEESPIFEKGDIQGGYSFPLSIPKTEINRRVFQFPDRVENADPTTIDQDFELYHSGLIRAAGLISITETDTRYQAFLSIGSGDFATKIAGIKLNEVDFGGDRPWVNKVEFTRADDFTLFPIYNPLFLTGLSGYNWPVNGFKLNHYTAGLFVVTGTFAISPYPFISYMVNQIFEQFGFSVEENILATDDELKKAVLYSAFDATKIEVTTEPKLVQVGIDPFTNEPIEEFIEVASTSRTMDTINLADSMPDILISDFLKWLRNRFNLAYVFDKFNNVRIISREQLILKSSAIDITDQAESGSKTNSILPPDGFKLSWDHDEADEAFAEDEFQKIEENLEFFKGSVETTADLSALTPDLNDIYYIREIDFYNQYAYTADIGDGTPGYTWQPWSIDFQNYITGSGEEEFNTGISTLRMINFKRIIGANIFPVIRCPFTEQPSNGIERPEYEPFSPRILLYQGLQKDEDNNDIPMGSSSNFDVDGNQIAGANLTMRWEGEFGVYEKLYKNYLTWWMMRKQVDWIITDPSLLEFAEKYAIDRSQFLVKNRSTVYSIHSIEPTECEFYLV